MDVDIDLAGNESVEVPGGRGELTPLAVLMAEPAVRAQQQLSQYEAWMCWAGAWRSAPVEVGSEFSVELQLPSRDRVALVTGRGRCDRRSEGTLLGYSLSYSTRGADAAALIPVVAWGMGLDETLDGSGVVRIDDVERSVTYEVTIDTDTMLPRRAVFHELVVIPIEHVHDPFRSDSEIEYSFSWD